MKTKTLLTLLLFSCVCSLSIAQKTHAFYVEVPDIKYLPKVTHSKNGNRIAYADTDNTALNTVFNACKVYSCEKAFKNTKRSELIDFFLLETNDSLLGGILEEKFESIYPQIVRSEWETLDIPNDYGSSGGYLVDQVELDHIRGPEAWDLSKGSKNIIIGIADTHFKYDHEDLKGTIDVVINAKDNLTVGRTSEEREEGEREDSFHGTEVSSVAAANTNNGLGMSAIGRDSYVYAGLHQKNNMSVVHDLAFMDGVKVINASWYLVNGTMNSEGEMNSLARFYAKPTAEITDQNKVLVVAAGNGQARPGDPKAFVFPASYKNVISVSTVGHMNKRFGDFETFLDGHEFLYKGQIRSHQHNDSVDIVAPGYGVITAHPRETNEWAKNSYSSTRFGTSFSAPMVAGTVALMFDVNYCLSSKEVETILKLTAVKIDTLPQNLPYHGKLGAGKLDAYEAVKMAKDMHDPFGTVEVKNRILYRPWFYKLVTAPYEIKMTNNTVTEGAKLKFRARNTIELTSGYYAPGPGGYIDLAIDTSIKADCAPPPTNTASAKNSSSAKSSTSLSNSASGLTLFPNPTSGRFSLSHNESIGKIVISDITGKRIYYKEGLNDKNISVDISKVKSGIYFIEITETSGAVKGLKVIKE